MTKKIEVPKIGGPNAPTARGVTAADVAQVTQVTQAPPPPPSGAATIRETPSPPSARGSSPAGRRASDSAALTGTYRQVAPQTEGPAATSPEAAVERIASHLDYLTRATVEKYLDAHGGGGGPVVRRLAALGLASDENADWWAAVSEGVDPEILAELLRTAPGMPQHRDVIGMMFEFLLDAEVGGYRTVKAADATALDSGRRLLDVLVEEGTLTDARAADLATEFYGLRRRRGKKWNPDPNQSGTVTCEMAEAFEIVPLTDGEDEGLTLLVVADPGPVLLEAMKALTGRDVKLLVETPGKFRETLEEWSAQVAKAEKKRRGGSRSRSRKRADRPAFRLDQDSFAGISYAPEMVLAILERATSVGATDIHLEPQVSFMRVRYRLDGILHDVTHLKRNLGEDTISRIKVMSDMDITERRKPQDGHVHQVLNDNPYDFRIATVPTSRGERMSIRITAGSKEVPQLDILGLDDWEMDKMQDFTKRSHGIVLASGPVGSGKTTSLYASIGELDAQQKNIMTIEDPVEIELPDVSQVHVNYKIGLDFSAGLRALLRQDPNIILVGEIRDDETAKVAVRGSLTGLLVYSSIHANSAPGAVTTLYNFDIPPFLLATSIVGVVAQRLVRTICEDCREEYEPDPALLTQAGFPPPTSTLPPPPKPKAKAKGKKKAAEAEAAAPEEEAEPVIYNRGRGCDNCYGTGYRGRTGIFEILDISEQMRQSISERAPEAELRKMAIEGGMQTLADRGRVRVLRGETTVEEFIRVLYQ
ncbi:MAG: type II/IV secretion system protein [Proteobacteria bacterium]|nr:type II/IV secretion system protein [Pseudomonadota bacterium]